MLPNVPSAPRGSHEIAELPDFSESNLYVVTGLLLPIWRRLPNEGCRVYRLQTDDGMRIIGRQVTPDWIARHAGRNARRSRRTRRGASSWSAAPRSLWPKVSRYGGGW